MNHEAGDRRGELSAAAALDAGLAASSATASRDTHRTGVARYFSLFRGSLSVLRVNWLVFRDIFRCFATSGPCFAMFGPCFAMSGPCFAMSGPCFGG